MKSKVHVRGLNINKEVLINDNYSDVLDESIIQKWQGILDITARIFDVPSALIMKLHEEEIEVFAADKGNANPYKAKEKEKLGLGLYCETVIGTDGALDVANALEDLVWRDNPDIKLGMINYLGLPLKWPSGEFFGTICVLDDKKRVYDETLIQLFNMIKDTIEKDLKLISNYIEINKSIDIIRKSQDLLIVHEKNHLTNKLISNITHDIGVPLRQALEIARNQQKTIKSEHDKLNIINHMILTSGSLLDNLEKASELLDTIKKMYSKISRGIIEEINISDHVRKVLESMRDELDNNKVEVLISIPEDLLMLVNVEALNQVIINLVVNSIQHAFVNKKYKNIILSATEVNNKIKITFKDNGLGISKDRLCSAINSHSSEEDNTISFGIGLRLVKDIVEKELNGTISCNSEEGQGAEFIIEIPKIFKI